MNSGMNSSPRNPRKACMHVIDWEKDVSYYVDHIAEAGFEDIFGSDDMGISIGGASEDDSLGMLFTAFIDNPIANANFTIFYDVLIDIVMKRVKRPESVFRGDIIYLNFVSDNQDAFLFWDGHGLIRGDKNENGKYKIPSEFKIFEEFPPHYWDKYPHDSYHEEKMTITKGLLKTSDMKVYLPSMAIFTVYFQAEKYLVIMTKPFAEKVLDSLESQKFICGTKEIPNDVMDFLRSQGMDSSTIYDRAICLEEFDEDELNELLEELNMNL
jgi:hypothetical protein